MRAQPSAHGRVLAREVCLAQLPGVHGLPPRWKPGIRAFYRRTLEVSRSVYARHLWANEVGSVRPHVTDEGWAAREAAERGAGDSFGSQWAFPPRGSVREMLLLLSRYGYRGFNRFLRNPSAPRAAQEVEGMATLREEMVQHATGAVTK